MSAGITEMCILYLGGNEACMQSLRQSLTDYFVTPVFLLQARSPEEYEVSLGRRTFDVIVAEDDPAVVPAAAALRRARARCPGVPFISLTDAAIKPAVELIKNGAADCVPSGYYERLAFAVIREAERAKKLVRGRRADYVRILLSIVKDCINVPVERVLDALGDAMAMIADCYDSDRIVAYRFDFENGLACPTFEWSRSKKFHKIKSDKCIPLSNFEEALTSFSQNRMYVKDSPGDAEAVCAYHADYSDGQQGMISVFVTGRQKQWLGDEIAAFQIFSELIISMMARQNEQISVDENNRSNTLVLDALSEGVGLFGRDGTALSVNRCFAQRYGKTPDEVVGTKWNDFLPIEKYGSFLDSRLHKLQLAYDTGEYTELDDVRDGRWYHNGFYPVFENGKVASVAVISADFTDRLMLEQEAIKSAVLEAEAELLRENEQELLAVLDVAANGSIVVDISKGTVRYSAKLLSQAGCENLPEEELPDALKKMIHPEDRDRVLEARDEAIKNRSPFLETEHRIILPNGSTIWVLARGKLVYGENGALLKLFGTYTDITEQKIFEQALRESGRFLQDILDSITDALYVVDAQWRIIYVNNKSAEWWGCQKEDVLGRLLNDVFPKLRETDDWNIYQYAAVQKTPVYWETQIPHSRIWIDVHAYPTTGGGLAVYFRDITERKKADEALRKSERKAQTLIGQLERAKTDLTEEVGALRRLHRISSEHLMQNDLVIIYKEIIDAAIEIAHAGKGYIQIYVPQENCLKIIAQRGFGESFLNHYAVVPLGCMPGGAALERRERIIVEDTANPLVFSDAEIILHKAEDVGCGQSTPMISCTGTVYGVMNTYCGSAHHFSEHELQHLDLLARHAADCIERKRSEVALEISEKNATTLVEALQRADRSKNEFLNHLSHELRNPLATINAAISLIEITDDFQQIRETNAILKSETKQLGRLVDDLLDVTRITTNKIKIKKRSINLTEIFLTSANNFKPRFKDRNVQFSVDIGKAPVNLSADPARIMQIIENLLTNALMYTDDGGAVLMTLRVDGTHAVISVKDNGIGIKSEDLPLLFEAFYQSEKPSNRFDSGLGLGLAIVKAIVELHGGHAAAFSKGVGHGSVFTVTLPLDSGLGEPISDD